MAFGITEALTKIKQEGKKRAFTQTIDLIINLRDVDVKSAESRFSEEVVLPAGRGKAAKVGVIGSSLAIKAKGVADELIDEAKLAQIEKDAKALGQIIKKCDFFLAEAPLMLRIGKSLGKILGPAGKMPKPVAPGVDPATIIKKAKETVRLKLAAEPVVKCAIGTEAMSSEDLEKNFDAVLAGLEKRLPRGKVNIKSVLIKSTMGPVVRIKY